MLPLRCSAQNYDWGKPASQSEVAQLAKFNGSTVDEAKPYAELWMGTHPNCPAVVASTGQSLKAWIDAHPQSLGAAVQQRFGGDLPFLFKVLSVAKALSIQSHPDKALAERLHAEHPKLYADPNHKPEMALALTPFSALCGFMHLGPLAAGLRQQPELAALVGAERVAALEAVVASGEAGGAAGKQALKAAFTALMTSEPAAVSSAVDALVGRLRAEAAAGRELSDKERLALKLNEQFPADVGVLSSFFLNLIELSPGQAVYLSANTPHAYLDGELMECMAASDNVIRAGLTPKFKHTDVLCESLTYETGLPEVLEGTPVVPAPAASTSPLLSLYRPPFEEFEMQLVRLAGGASPALLPVNPGPVILLVQRGGGKARAVSSPLSGAGGSSELVEEAELARGTILFVPAGTALEVTAAPGGEPLTAWAAATNGNFFALNSVLNGSAAPAAAQEAVAA